MMITYEALNEQNHRITELSNVLRYLFNDRSMCDTGSCCDLFYQYVDLVKQHIDTVDKEMYSEMLQSSDESINNTAKNFMSGSSEIKKILKSFTKKWCPAKTGSAIRIKEYDSFIEDTNKLFDIVLQRILDETEHLYPRVRNLRHSKAA